MGTNGHSGGLALRGYRERMHTGRCEYLPARCQIVGCRCSWVPGRRWGPPGMTFESVGQFPAEEAVEKGDVDLGQLFDIGGGDTLVDLVHGLADKAEFGDRAIG